MVTNVNEGARIVARYLCCLLALIVGWSGLMFMFDEQYGIVEISGLFGKLVYEEGEYDPTTWLLFLLTAAICVPITKRFDFFLTLVGLSSEIALGSLLCYICFPKFKFHILAIAECSFLIVGVLAIQLFAAYNYVKYKGGQPPSTTIIVKIDPDLEKTVKEKPDVILHYESLKNLMVEMNNFKSIEQIKTFPSGDFVTKQALPPPHHTDKRMFEHFVY